MGVFNMPKPQNINKYCEVTYLDKNCKQIFASNYEQK